MVSKTMSATVRLNDIVEALEMQFDEFLSFLDLDTGKVETVSKEVLSEAEEPAEDEDLDLPDDEESELAKRIVSSDRFLRLPTKFDVHEWAIMEDFSRNVQADRIREDLLHAIHGAGAFRNFKYIVRRDGIEQAWFAFRTDALRQIAIDWCEESQISWE